MTKWAEPPVPAGCVRLWLHSGDYETPAQWSEWKPGPGVTPSPAWIFDVPAEQEQRWREAYDASEAAENEIEALITERGGEIPPGWHRTE